MIRILHAADLHLDSPFGSLPREPADFCRNRQRMLPDMLADLCGDRNCDLLLLAGDIFDGTPKPETVNTLYRALGRCKAEVFIAPGNHDPYTANSVWAKTVWPENVHIFSGDMTCITLPRLGCRVWGAAFRDREAEDLLRPIPRSDDDFFEIGVFHGDPLNRGPYHPISPQVLQTCGLDYLALGHIHQGFGPEQGGSTLYGWPGTPMGRGFDECGEKGVLYVELEENRRESTFVPLRNPKFEILTCPAEELRLPPGTEDTLCRLILTGESDPVDIPAVEQALKDRFLYLEVRDETTPRRNPWEGLGEQTLRGLALSRLKERYDLGETTAELAARYVLAALEGREQP